MSKSNDKKSVQLGMNAGTAQNRLLKDILWSMVVKTGQETCCKCGEIMDRSTFSIEHLVPWLDSEDPVGLFFSIDNIGFSHLRCNIGARRSYKPLHPCGSYLGYKNGCRCSECTSANAEANRSRYTPDSRKQRYARTGN